MVHHPKNFSVKIIGGIPYIYSWSYKKKNSRTNHVAPRYKWKYQGRYDSKDIQAFLNQFNTEELGQLKIQVKQKLKAYEERQEQINRLKEKEPFKSRYARITKIKNRTVREQEYKKFTKELINIIVQEGLE